MPDGCRRGTGPGSQLFAERGSFRLWHVPAKAGEAPAPEGAEMARLCPTLGSQVRRPVEDGDGRHTYVTLPT
jgi:hypothetical protein